MNTVEEGYNGDEGKKIRDKRAKELRAAGYVVVCKKWDFSDLARGARYTLTAKRGAQ